ncbi:glucose 1-dehydrogenase [Nocardioides sp. WL0053]|uniref:Glucose 1-dehydrogenase n=1 Tax=Nocardioides jiangsuensis TaxID=2866161 RepID=A0ABS7RRA9_9ACTN|nr:glucose 1-dehydrogenase [Nocardioides jiangsuensis]MBY9076598.1 glucose 1-dehydrogenase [Nocardioides jiangsuensis]
MGKLDGRVAVVTGGARGIGASIARLFVAEGATVVIADRLESEGKALAAELGEPARFASLDVADEAQWQAVMDLASREFGAVGILVNNAGIVEFGTIEEQSPKEFQHVLDVNLVGPWMGMHAAVPSLRRAGRGVVINVSSTAGLMGYSNLGAYVASKWGLRGLTKTAALELAPDGIRVCSIHPGPIRTPMTAQFDDTMTAAQPIARFGEPEEVAKMALFVAADATYSTGCEFVVDGGATVGSLLVADAE